MLVARVTAPMIPFDVPPALALPEPQVPKPRPPSPPHLAIETLDQEQLGDPDYMERVAMTNMDNPAFLYNVCKLLMEPDFWE